MLLPLRAEALLILWWDEVTVTFCDTCMGMASIWDGVRGVDRTWTVGRE